MKRKLQPVKPISDKLVAIDWTLTHCPIFQRNGGAGIIPISTKDGYWELHSTCFPDFNDLDVLLGALKLYQDCQLKGKVIAESSYNYKDKDAQEMDAPAFTIKATHSQLCKYSGLTVSGQNYKRIDTTLKKLALLTGYYYGFKKNDDGSYNKTGRSETTRVLRFLSYHERNGNNNKLTFDASFIHSCFNNRILVRYKHIQELGNQIHKAMLVFIDGNEKFLLGGIQEDKIMRFLGVSEPKRPEGKIPSKKSVKKYHDDLQTYKGELKEVRRNIKEALKLFIKKGFIKNYILPDRSAKGSNRKIYVGKNKFCSAQKTFLPCAAVGAEADIEVEADALAEAEDVPVVQAELAPEEDSVQNVPLMVVPMVINAGAALRESDVYSLRDFEADEMLDRLELQHAESNWIV